MKRFLLIIFLDLVILLRIFAQDVEVSAKLDSNRILIGDHLKFTFDVFFKPGYQIQVPVFTDTLASKVEIISIFRPDTQVVEGKVLYRQQMLVTSFDSGIHYIPSIPVLVTKSGGYSDTLYTDPIPLVVQSFKVDPASDKFFDIKLPFGAPVTLREIAPYGISFLFVAALIFAIIYIYRRHKQHKPLLIKPKPTEPPHEIALRRLDILSGQKYWQQGLVKEFHSELTDIIRQYIDGRYSIQAPELTTDETLGEIVNHIAIENELYVILRNMLQLADYVKFAKAQPLPDENEMSLRNAYRFVLETKQTLNLRTDEDSEQQKVEKPLTGEVKI